MAGQALADDTKKFQNTHADYNGAGGLHGQQEQSHTQASKPAWDVSSASELGNKYIQAGRDAAKIDLVSLDQRMHDKADYMRAKGDEILYNAMGDLWGGVTADWKSPEASKDYDINETRTEINKTTDKSQSFLQDQIDNVWKKSAEMANSV
jgi:hypothetical protein